VSVRERLTWARAFMYLGYYESVPGQLEALRREHKMSHREVMLAFADCIRELR